MTGREKSSVYEPTSGFHYMSATKTRTILLEPGLYLDNIYTLYNNLLPVTIIIILCYKKDRYLRKETYQ